MGPGAERLWTTGAVTPGAAAGEGSERSSCRKTGWGQENAPLRPRGGRTGPGLGRRGRSAPTPVARGRGLGGGRGGLPGRGRRGSATARRRARAAARVGPGPVPCTELLEITHASGPAAWEARGPGRPVALRKGSRVLSPRGEGWCTGSFLPEPRGPRGENGKERSLLRCTRFPACCYSGNRCTNPTLPAVTQNGITEECPLPRGTFSGGNRNTKRRAAPGKLDGLRRPPAAEPAVPGGAGDRRPRWSAFPKGARGRRSATFLQESRPARGAKPGILVHPIPRIRVGARPRFAREPRPGSHLCRNARLSAVRPGARRRTRRPEGRRGPRRRPRRSGRRSTVRRPGSRASGGGWGGPVRCRRQRG